MVSYNHVKFGGHRHSDSRDTMFLVHHVCSKDHVIKGSCDPWIGFILGTTPPCQLWCHNYGGSGNMFFVCHMALQDHVIERSFDLWLVAPYGESRSCQIW